MNTQTPNLPNNNPVKSWHRLALAAFALSLGAASSQAATVTWTGNSSIEWGTAGNWIGGVPGTTDTVLWNGNSTQNLSGNTTTARTVGGLTVINPSGAVTISGGSLMLGSGGIDMSAATQNLTINNLNAVNGATQTWNVATGRTLAITTASFAVQGSQTLTLAGSGAIALGGWVQVGAVGQTGTINQTGGTLSSTVANRLLFIGHSTNATAGIGVYNLSNGTINLSGSGGYGIRLGQTGAGADGTFNMTGGTINSTGATLLEVAVADGSKGAYNQSAGSATFETVSIASLGTLGAATTGTGNLTGGTMSVTTLNVGTRENGSFTLSGSGVLNLAGAATVGGASGSSGTLNLNGGTVNLTTSSSALTLGATGVINANGVSFSNQNSVAATTTVAANMVLGAGGLTAAPSSGASRWISFTGNLSGTGGFTANVTTGAQVNLSGSNTFEGGVTIQGGYLGISKDSAIPVGSALAMIGNLSMSANATVGSLTGTGLIFTGAGPYTITAGYGNASSTFAGTSSNGVALAKTGTGTLTLTNALAHTAGTTIANGVLQIGNGSTTGSVSGNITNNSALVFNRSNALAYNGTISGTGSVTKSGAGTLTLSAANTCTGLTTVSAGELDLNTTGGQSIAGNLTVSGGTAKLVQANQIATTATVTVTSGSFNTNNLTQTVSAFNMSSGSLDGTTGVLTAATYGLSGGTVNALLGNGTITVTTGTTTLGSAGRLNSGSSLTVNSGQLTLGGAESVASIAGTGGTIALGANTLTTGGASTTYAGTISGTGGLTKAGTGNQTLTGNNTFTGATAVTGGTLTANATHALSSTSGITIATGGTLLLDASTATNSTATLALGNGTVALKQSGAGVSNTLGALTLTANSTIDFGTIDTGNNILTLGGVTSWTPGQILNIWNWSGTPRTAGGTDQLRVSLTATGWETNLNKINFYSDAGSTLLGGGGAMFVGYELTAVPEPSTWISMAALALGGTALTLRRWTSI